LFWGFGPGDLCDEYPAEGCGAKAADAALGNDDEEEEALEEDADADPSPASSS
jgi:hypothetical protein